MKIKIHSLLITLMFSSSILLADAFVQAKSSLNFLTGCFDVNYSFYETESLNPSYSIRDSHYNVRAKELILFLEDSPTSYRIQHILFSTNESGELAFIMKHTGEQWTHNKSFLYDFIGNEKWSVKNLDQTQDLWIREVTALDDGPRYQCASKFDFSSPHAEWGCSSFAPIPGRETRDMGRDDYNSLDRTTRLLFSRGGWAELQNNVKIIYNQDNNERITLAKEIGETFYTQRPIEDCNLAKEWAEARLKFWQLTREVWSELLDGSQHDTKVLDALEDGVLRYAKVEQLERRHHAQINDDNRQEIKKLIKDLLRQYIVAE